MDNSIFKNLNTYKQIRQEIVDAKFFHSHIFLCKDTFTQHQFLDLVAETILCKNLEACGKCDDCLKVKQNSHPDLKIYGAEKSFLTEDAKNIIEQIALKPMLAQSKVFVIYDFDKATISAQNKLLKVVEEPNNNVFFLLGIKSEENVLPTIKSRSKLQIIQPFDNDMLKKVIEKEYGFFDKSIGSYTDGYVGNYVLMMNDGSFKSDYDFIVSLLENMQKSKDVLNFSNKFCENKTKINNKMQILHSFLEDMLFCLINKQNLIKNTQIKDSIESWSKLWTLNALSDILKELNLCKQKFESNVNVNLVMDNFLMKMLEVKFLCKKQ